MGPVLFFMENLPDLSHGKMVEKNDYLSGSE
jgi:hypothetical protein